MRKILILALFALIATTSFARRYECGVCSGNGVITCLLCGGAGGSMQWRCLTYPPYSQYYEFVPCIACGGNKVVACTWCGGTGIIDSSAYESQGTSGGYSGNSYNGGGYSSGSSSTGNTCRICGGSGDCTSCGGRGGEWIDSGTYTGEDTKSWINCPSCRGNKRCFNCYGTGKQ